MAIVSEVCLVVLTKNCERHLVMLTSDIYKLATSYSCSNNCLPFCQFYSNLKILQNSPLLIKE